MGLKRLEWLVGTLRDFLLVIDLKVLVKSFTATLTFGRELMSRLPDFDPS